MRIDAHHHFWRYNSNEFGWIDDSMQRIRRDFLPDDLKHELHAVDIDGVVTVQSRQSIEETEWLLSVATENDFIKGVVGWVPLADRSVRDDLSKYAANNKFKAVRHVVQGEPDDRFILGKDFNVGVSALADFDLVYDILVFERQLLATIEFVDRHPNQVFVLDHIAKPQIKGNLIDDWAGLICDLAQRPNIYCKISGMVTEADFQNWNIDQLKPYWDMVLAAFGPSRIMFGSDWPVCMVACEYYQWYATVLSLASYLTTAEQAQLFGETATKVYRLDQ